MILPKAIIKLLVATILFFLYKDILTSFDDFMKIIGCIGFVVLVGIGFIEDRVFLIAFSLFGVILLNPVLSISFSEYIKKEIYLITAMITALWFIVDLFQQPGKDNIS